jgi:hypothetical protein
MSALNLISASEVFKMVVKYLHNGNATTPEVIIFEKKGVNIEVKFDLCFSYDWSNGIVADEAKLNISNLNKITAIEKKYIEQFVKENYPIHKIKY